MSTLVNATVTCDFCRTHTVQVHGRLALSEDCTEVQFVQTFYPADWTAYCDTKPMKHRCPACTEAESET